jgi:hypothetical protein
MAKLKDKKDEKATTKKLSDNHKKILSDNTKLKVAIGFLKELITADGTGQCDGRSKEKIKSEAITFINELI